MPTFRERIAGLFRSRIGKYNADSIASELGLMGYGRGLDITERGAMGLSSVYACVYRIATTLATLDLNIHTKESGRVELAPDHPAYNLIREEPNAYQTAPEFWEYIISHAVATGRGHAVIERDSRGYATAMHAVPTEHVELKRTDKGDVYKVDGFGMIPPENVLCIFNLQRKSPIRLHRENLGLAAAAQRYGSEYFTDGQMTGILTTDQPLRNEQMNMIRESWRAQGGASTRLVPHGLKFQRVSIAPDEAQFIQTRKFQAEEVARIFGVPPALIQLESQTTYNNVEQQNLMYGRHTIAPWAKRIEKEIDKKLLMTFERPKTYSRFDLSGMYRGDMSARKEFYEGMIRLGVMSINEVRAKEELNPVTNGEHHFVQVNQVTLEKFPEYSEKLAGDSAPQPPTDNAIQ